MTATAFDFASELRPHGDDQPGYMVAHDAMAPGGEATHGRHGLVESVAAHVADEIERLSADDRALSFIHGDINPSNVLIADGEPKFIDWQSACYGPFYLDLPHHLSIPALAEEYRLARASLGDSILSEEFAAGFRAAAHYIGLRYIWWTLDLWREDPSQSEWVRYYLALITL